MSMLLMWSLGYKPIEDIQIAESCWELDIDQSTVVKHSYTSLLYIGIYNSVANFKLKISCLFKRKTEGQVLWHSALSCCAAGFPLLLTNYDQDSESIALQQTEKLYSGYSAQLSPIFRHLILENLATTLPVKALGNWQVTSQALEFLSTHVEL